MQIDYMKAMDWIRQKWSKPSECPICAKDDWGIGDEIVELREFHGGKLNVGSKIIPCFSVFCRFCGYTIFFNAIIAGLVDVLHINEIK